MHSVIFTACLLLHTQTVTDGPQESTRTLIREEVADRDQAWSNLPAATGKGKYRLTVTSSEGKQLRRELAVFRLAYQHPQNFIQLRFHPDWLFDGVYSARVIASDGRSIHETSFMSEKTPIGRSCTAFDAGFLDPVFTPTGGNLIKSWAFVEQLEQDYAEVSLLDRGRIQVLRGDAVDGTHAAELWIDTQQDKHVVRYRCFQTQQEQRYLAIDAAKEWEKSAGLWYVKSLTTEERRSQNSQSYTTVKTEFELSEFIPQATIPTEVFSLHATALPDGALRVDWHTGKTLGRYSRAPAFDLQKVIDTVGSLPEHRRVR